MLHESSFTYSLTHDTRVRCSAALATAAKTRDNKTRHWNVDDYMVARRERERARRVGGGSKEESERAKIAVEFVPGEIYSDSPIGCYEGL